MMSEKRFRVRFEQEDGRGEIVNEKGVELTAREVVDKLNEQQAIIDKQELRLQHLEEVLELSENLNKSYREKLIDMNLKMMRI